MHVLQPYFEDWRERTTPAEREMIFSLYEVRPGQLHQMQEAAQAHAIREPSGLIVYDGDPALCDLLKSRIEQYS
jgi:hypothetical protein